MNKYTGTGTNTNTTDIVETIDTATLDKMTKADKKAFFLESFGNMKIDATAVLELRKRSMI